MENGHCDQDKWYAAQIRHNGFARAEANLDRQGFETFMPLSLETGRHVRQMRGVLQSVFQGIYSPNLGRSELIGAKSDQLLGLVN